jgi:hypothetical protein
MKITANDPSQKPTLENKLVEVNDVPLLEPAKLAEEIKNLPRMKICVKSKSSSPTLSPISRNTAKSYSCIEKEHLSRRLEEIRTPAVRYNLRSMRKTPPSTGKETV